MNLNHCLVTVGIAVVGLSGCAQSPAISTPVAPKPAAVVRVVTDPATIGAYTPASTTVMAGQEVEWRFEDLNPHTISADPGHGGYSSGPSSRGRTFTHRFTQPGTYPYHCAIHPEMHALVAVIG